MRKLALYLSLVMIFTIPWETAITISTLGTLTKLIGFAAAGIWVASVLITGRLRKFSAYHIAVFIFIIFNAASIFWTVNYDLTFIRVKTYLQLAILTWILWDLFATPQSLTMAMQVFIFGAYVTIASQLINFASGQTIGAYSAGRFSGAGQNAVELALILSLSIPLAWFLAITQKPGQWAVILKIVNFSFIPLALLATILTASRTSLVTNIPGLLYIAGSMRKIKPVYRLLIFISFFATILVVQPLIPNATFERLSTIGASISGSDLGGRMRLWTGSFDIFLNHPYLGIGSNALSSASQLGSFAHNTFLSIMAELGLVGIILFLFILFFVFYQAIKQPRAFSILWITTLVIWTVGVATLTWEYTKPTWFFLNLVIISGGIYGRLTGYSASPLLQRAPFADKDYSVV